MKQRKYINRRFVCGWENLVILLLLMFTACTLEGDIAEERENQRHRCDNVVPGATLATKLGWLQTNAQSNTNYTVEVNVNESIFPQTLSYSGKSNVTITLRGILLTRTIDLSSNGSMFTIGSGVTLVLDENITLRGRNSNTAALVTVNIGGTLYMNIGSAITGNTSSGNGGGVRVWGGTFVMNGGLISNNRINSDGTGNARGSGVFTSGAFTMNGGSITGNTFSGTAGWGGGVIVNSGTFTMNGGIITNNNAITSGGGVYVHTTFTLNGGTISSNTAGWGGGIYIGSGSTGTAKTFNMSGGNITDNTAQNWGGGVGVVDGIINKTGGTITGYSSDMTNGNRVRNTSGAIVSNSGHTVYAVKDNTIRRKETTAGLGANLWFNGTGSSAVWSGSWDF